MNTSKQNHHAPSMNIGIYCKGDSAWIKKKKKNKGKEIA